MRRCLVCKKKMQRKETNNTCSLECEKVHVVQQPIFLDHNGIRRRVDVRTSSFERVYVGRAG